MPVDGTRAFPFREEFADGRVSRALDRPLIEEAPVALEINGVGYAVMMATPVDLEDYALGFCLSEQLIASPHEFVSAQAAPVDAGGGAGGWMLRVQLGTEGAAPLLERARLRLAEGSCGLCGIESLEQVMRPLQPVTAPVPIGADAIFSAAAQMRDQQVMGRATGAAHAAALCDPTGKIRLVREDVGRHNAFDKLIGAAAREGLAMADHFVLLTARCSFELVQKAVIAGVPLLATISAASTLACEQAASHGLKLVSLVRQDSLLEL